MFDEDMAFYHTLLSDDVHQLAWRVIETRRFDSKPKVVASGTGADRVECLDAAMAALERYQEGDA